MGLYENFCKKLFLFTLISPKRLNFKCGGVSKKLSKGIIQQGQNCLGDFSVGDLPGEKFSMGDFSTGESFPEEGTCETNSME